jgi:ABC-type polysaccharide/polyol phosphate export permease
VIGELAPSVLLLVPLLAIQFVLLCGLAWVCSAVAVYLRDIPNLVLVTTLLLFYVTPVFYSFEMLEARRVGEGARSVLELNPLGVLIEAYRAVLIGEPGPSVLAVGEVAVASVAVAVVGLLLFRRLEPRFADEL